MIPCNQEERFGTRETVREKGECEKRRGEESIDGRVLKRRLSVLERGSFRRKGVRVLNLKQIGLR